jgi:hypothetical protein
MLERAWLWCLWLPLACGKVGGGDPDFQYLGSRGEALTGSIPATRFGLHVLHYETTGDFPDASFGAFRIWDVGNTRWQLINTAPGRYDWKTLDDYLLELKGVGVEEVGYTAAVVPHWASSVPDDADCDYDAGNGGANGGCDLPADLLPDGSGTDQTWIDFITAIAQHANDAGFLETHAHIGWWEPWNEWSRNPVINANAGDTPMIRATYAQMVRLTEDMRCVITGTGVQNALPCKQPAIDTSARILTPSTLGDSFVMQNFLYCDGGFLTPDAGCTTGARGSQAVDVINSHFYTFGKPPEQLAQAVQNYRSFLSAADLAKPFWSDEGSWGKDTYLTDPDLQAAFVARYYLVGNNSGLAEIYWYAYDACPAGSEAGTAPLLCGGMLTPAGVAHQQVFGWLVGKTPTGACTDSGTIWKCDFADSAGAYEAIWDTDKSCDAGTCETQPQDVSGIFTEYEDLAGNLAIVSNQSVPVGAKPIWLISTAATDAGADAGPGSADGGSPLDAGPATDASTGAPSDAGASPTDAGSSDGAPRGCGCETSGSPILAWVVLCLATRRSRAAARRLTNATAKTGGRAP